MREAAFQRSRLPAAGLNGFVCRARTSIPSAGSRVSATTSGFEVGGASATSVDVSAGASCADDGNCSLCTGWECLCDLLGW